MKQIILPLLFLGFTVAASSQIPFKKGYIVTTAGDTIQGFLKRNTYAELAQTVEFREGRADASSNLYTTQHLKYFAFDESDLFEAVTYTDLLDSNKQKTEFARLALEGYYNVYVLARQTLSNFLIKSSDTAYLLYNDKVDPGGSAVQIGNYRNTLAFLSRNCNKSNIDFARVQFLQHDITRVVTLLNECNQSHSVIHHHNEKPDKHLVVYAGAFAIKDQWSQRSAGAELRLRNNVLSRRLAFVVGVHYSRTLDIDKEYIYYTRGWLTTDQITEIYSVPVALHYTFLEHAIQPYIYLGFAGAYKKTNFETSFDKGFQGKYGVSILGGAGIEVYPMRNIAIKADWRYELLVQHPTLGLAFRL